ncbi:hypothetical protein L6164_017921 [Bauhinia variegata]|uniref:Uncharacterized protein n=1 Tax=Bauhinia variegata TaxID=167791 RepID=A0ACB9NBA2_BAUVA|nr:hypothetical protein L6164_017921 [Bauhinia variegata]
MVAARPGFQKPESCSSSRKSHLDPIPLTENGTLPADLVLEDPDSHFIYICTKIDDVDTYPLTAHVLQG